MNLLELESYKPSSLFDTVRSKLKVNSDSQLSGMLNTHPSVISKIRNGIMPMTGNILLSIHEVTGLSIRELRKLMGDTRKFF